MITTADLEKFDSTMTVGELKEYIRKQAADAKSKEDKRKQDIRDWFDSYVGKCISINRNGSSFTVFKMTKPFELGKLCTKFPVLYNIYDGPRYSDSKSNCLRVEEEVDSEINKLWMNCPYDDECRVGGKTGTMKVITEEEYNRVAALYDSLKIQIAELKLTLK